MPHVITGVKVSIIHFSVGQINATDMAFNYHYFENLQNHTVKYIRELLRIGEKSSHIRVAIIEIAFKATTEI